MTALYERERSGRGQWVQSSLLQSGLGLMDFQAARFLVEGEVPGQVGNDHPTGMPTSAYATSDGSRESGRRRRSHVGQGLRGHRAAPPWPPTRDSRRARTAHATGRPSISELGAAFRTRTSAEWIDLLNAAGVPCGPIYSMDQVFSDPQVVATGMAATVQHETRGPIRVLAPTATSVAHARASLERSLVSVGQDTDDVLG
jgi:crotonobetainyl-CoA:carnitine CoA-transferase CaiB-like acyl-CoA transferase